MSDPETYLGDGLYASMDGGMLKLRAPSDSGDHVVYLEPEVWAALKRYAAATIEASAEERDEDG